VSRSLKNETNTSLIELILSLDLVDVELSLLLDLVDVELSISLDLIEESSFHPPLFVFSI
jgi:hypothetical protein